ncbi:MAG: hypothetical protein HONBIEJF_00673 [Fimbriimonadaceae bacterium]|nr:hypothetical protein [Fimbriimonadaceae bacterium]
MHYYLMPTLPMGPQVMRTIVRNIPPDKLDTPTHPGRFTPRQVIAHLADWEPVLLTRMKIAIENPGGLAQGYDEMQWAIDHEYHKLDPHVQADLFIQRRQGTIEFLEGLSPDLWDRQYNHSERGLMSVYDTANMLVGHDMYHVEQLIHLVDSKTAGTW